MSSSVVAITGSTGFVGSSVLAHLVRGLTDATVSGGKSFVPPHTHVIALGRKEHAPEWMKKLGVKDEGDDADAPFRYRGSLDLASASVSDLTKALRGVTALVAVAHPMDGLTSGSSASSSTIEEHVAEVERRTNDLFKAAAATGTCKRIVFTSSMAAACGNQCDTDPTHLWSEDDWNDAPASLYSAGKTAGEKAAWAAAKEHGLDLTTILPTMVLGPLLPGQQPASTNRRLLSIARDSAKNGISFGATGVVDSRDVADVHVQALVLNTAVGERYIAALPNQYSTKELAQVATAVAPSEAVRVRIGTGYSDPSHDSFTARKPSTRNAKVVALLGRELRPIEETIKDTLASFEREGCFDEE